MIYDEKGQPSGGQAGRFLDDGRRDSRPSHAVPAGFEGISILHAFDDAATAQEALENLSQKALNDLATLVIAEFQARRRAQAWCAEERKRRSEAPDGAAPRDAEAAAVNAAVVGADPSSRN